MRREPREGYLDFNKSVIKITEAHCSDRTKSMAGSWSNEWLHCNWLSMLLVFTSGYFNLTCLSKDATETRLL